MVIRPATNSPAAQRAQPPPAAVRNTNQSARSVDSFEPGPAKSDSAAKVGSVHDETLLQKAKDAVGKVEEYLKKGFDYVKEHASELREYVADAKALVDLLPDGGKFGAFKKIADVTLSVADGLLSFFDHPDQKGKGAGPAQQALA